MSQFASQSVSTRIALGFAIVLVLHLSVVMLQQWGQCRASADREQLVGLRAEVEACHRVERLSDRLRQQVGEFCTTGSMAAQDEIERLHNQLRAALGRMRSDADAAGSPGETDEIETVRLSLERHAESFATLASQQAQRQQLIDVELIECRAGFNELIEQLASTPVNSALLVKLTLAFHTAIDDFAHYSLAPDVNAAPDMMPAIADCRRLIGRLAESFAESPGNQIEHLRASIDRLERLFIGLEQATSDYQLSKHTQLDAESRKFEQAAMTLRHDLSQRAIELGRQIEVNSSQFTWASHLFSLATVALGVVVAWRISRSVAPALVAITTTFDGLARGLPIESIPCRERTDELGQLAAAAQVFRDKAVQTERLLDEATQVKELERQLAHTSQLESLGQLAAGIAHEINTPMQCVACNVEYLEEQFDYVLDVVRQLQAMLQGPPELWDLRKITAAELLDGRRFATATVQVREAVHEASGATRRIIEIVRAMKTMSHPGKLAHEPTDINSIVRDAATVSTNRWKYTATLELDLDETLPLPPANAAEINQIVLNILVNAADAIAEKFGPDRVCGQIVVKTWADARAVHLSVADNGTGIPVALRQRIFEPFFTTKDVGKGTGQGLALVFQSVRRHRGVVRVRSTEGEGTTFIVSLPLAEGDSIEGDAESLGEAATVCRVGR
jgi:signal transduction histidine kinase